MIFHGDGSLVRGDGYRRGRPISAIGWQTKVVGILPTPWPTVRLRANRAYAQMRGKDSQGRDRGFLPWVELFGHLSLDMERKVRRGYKQMCVACADGVCRFFPSMIPPPALKVVNAV